MSYQLDSGLSLKNDIMLIQTEPILHDIIIVYSDGVEIGACHHPGLAISFFFKAIVYSNVREAISNKVVFHDIKSTTLYAVLQFIHIESIDSMAISIAIEVFMQPTFSSFPTS